MYKSGTLKRVQETEQTVHHMRGWSHTHTHIYIYTHTQTHTHIHTYTHTHTLKRTHTHKHTHKHTGLNLNDYAFANDCTRTFLYCTEMSSNPQCHFQAFDLWHKSFIM